MNVWREQSRRRLGHPGREARLKKGTQRATGICVQLVGSSFRVHWAIVRCTRSVRQTEMSTEPGSKHPSRFCGATFFADASRNETYGQDPRLEGEQRSLDFSLFFFFLSSGGRGKKPFAYNTSYSLGCLEF